MKLPRVHHFGDCRQNTTSHRRCRRTTRSYSNPVQRQPTPRTMLSAHRFPAGSKRARREKHQEGSEKHPKIICFQESMHLQNEYKNNTTKKFD